MPDFSGKDRHERRVGGHHFNTSPDIVDAHARQESPGSQRKEFNSAYEEGADLTSAGKPFLAACLPGYQRLHNGFPAEYWIRCVTQAGGGFYGVR